MPEISQRNKLEQGRAAFAYECAEKGKKLGGGPKKENGKIKDSKEAISYKGYAKSIPMLIKTNGLGATFAYVKSRGKKPYDLLYQQTQEWLYENKAYLFKEKELKEDLTKTIISLDSKDYRAVTVEVLALFSWLRRFDEGLIEGESNE